MARTFAAVTQYSRGEKLKKKVFSCVCICVDLEGSWGGGGVVILAQKFSWACVFLRPVRPLLVETKAWLSEML